MAVEVSRKGHYPSKTACAKAHRISPSTLTTRLHKAMSPKEPAALHPKLTMCQRGLILQPSDVLYMLELVLSARLKASSRKPTVNDDWIKKFIDVPVIRATANAQTEDPEMVNDWIRRGAALQEQRP